jgi:hypothetical protein
MRTPLVKPKFFRLFGEGGAQTMSLWEKTILIRAYYNPKVGLDDQLQAQKCFQVGKKCVLLKWGQNQQMPGRALRRSKQCI